MDSSPPDLLWPKQVVSRIEELKFYVASIDFSTPSHRHLNCLAPPRIITHWKPDEHGSKAAQDITHCPVGHFEVSSKVLPRELVSDGVKGQVKEQIFLSIVEPDPVYNGRAVALRHLDPIVRGKLNLN